MLYQLEIRRADPQQVLREFWQDRQIPQDVMAFASALFAGTAEHREAIDPMIARQADNWDLKRMAVIDRNILRLGVYELLHREDVPPKVCLNEAIDLAKRFGDTESSRFINGILDAIHKTHARPSTA